MLANCMAVLPRLKELLKDMQSPALREIAGMDLLSEIREEIDVFEDRVIRIAVHGPERMT